MTVQLHLPKHTTSLDHSHFALAGFPACHALSDTAWVHSLLFYEASRVPGQK